MRFYFLMLFLLIHFTSIAQEDCSSPSIISNIPFNNSGILDGLADDYDMSTICGGGTVSGLDYVFKFTPASQIQIDIIVQITAGNSQKGLFLVEGCPDTGTCIEHDSGGNTLSLSDKLLQANTAYYIIVKGNNNVEFDITITEDSIIDCAINPQPSDDSIDVYPTYLSWEHISNDIDSFQIYYGSTNPPPYIKKITSGSTYNLPNYPPSNTLMYWSIIPFSEGIAGNNCPIWSFETPIVCQGQSLTTQEEVDNFSCELVAGSLSIVGNDITHLDSMYSLKSILGYLIIDECNSIQDLSGLEGLIEVRTPYSIGQSQIIITNNENLTSISNLSNLQTIDFNTIRISNNENLLSLVGLDSIESVRYLDLINNNSLNSLQGLANLNNATYFNIINNNNLLNLLDLENLYYVSSLDIDNNNNLNSLNGLNNIQILDHLYIYNNGLIDISALQNIITITGNFIFTESLIPYHCLFLKWYKENTVKGEMFASTNLVKIDLRKTLEYCNENDPDEDLLILSADNCDSLYNPLQLDSDEDGVGDICDNCPFIANANQVDMNNNFIGDICEYNNPGQRAQLEDGDLFVKSVNGLILKAPSGTCYRLVIDDEGKIITKVVPCPE